MKQLNRLISQGITIINPPTTYIDKNVRIGRGTVIYPKVKHLTYIGDAAIDNNVNIGAGTVVANYNGKDKHKTRIRKGAFIGSGSILIAPVKVGKRAITGAGAVVTKGNNVSDNSVVVGVPAKVLRNTQTKGEHNEISGNRRCRLYRLPYRRKTTQRRPFRPRP